LLKILMGFLDPDAGTVSIGGEDPESLAARRLVGFQSDSPYLSSRLTVRQFLELHRSLLGSNEPVTDLIGEFGITGVMDRPLARLSRGMRQKVELASALLGSPPVIILDEPTSSLDPPSVFQLRDSLLRRHREGVSIFFSSHNLTEVEAICERVLFIREGALIGEYGLQDVPPGFLEDRFRDHVRSAGLP
jgi:ABC-2 type transport system ATP-binding protein